MADSFLQILQLVSNDLESDAVFVDVGCGTGKANFVAALSSIGFVKVWGIEIVPGLIEAARDACECLIKCIESPHTKSASCFVNKDISACTSAGFGSELVIHINSLIVESEYKRLRADHLASALCQKIGRKKYRELLKPFKSFQKFITMSGQYFDKTTDDRTGFEWISCTDTILHVDEENIGHRDHQESTAESNEEELCKLIDASALELLLPLPEILFQCGDIFEIPWWETADVVYAASLLFNDEMIRELTIKAAMMKSGSFIISLKPLSVEASNWNTDEREKLKIDRITLISESFFKMSWQMAKVYIYKLI